MRKYIVWLAGITFICTMASCTRHSPKNINESETKTSDSLNNAASEATGDSVVTTENQNITNIKAELCTEGNCPCGDGFCAKNSVCIKDMCFCGAYLDEGYIGDKAVASNLYGEFECVRYYYDECGCCHELDYDFICTKPEGCKTGDGRKYPKSEITASIDDLDIGNGELYSEDGRKEKPALHIAFDGDGVAEAVGLHDRDDPACNQKYCQKYRFYEELIKERRLRVCGKKQPDTLKYIDRTDSGNPQIRNSFEFAWYDRRAIIAGITPIDLECQWREKCIDSGVTSEHIAEYGCEIGNASEYDKVGEIPEMNIAIGLRCIHSEGCTCGNTHCPRYAFCKDGSCVYDIFYQYRVCPGKDWDAEKSDLDNYVLIGDDSCNCEEGTLDEDCYENCWDHNMAGDEEFCREECTYKGDVSESGTVSEYERVCYEQCYWNHYESTMTGTDPCKD